MANPFIDPQTSKLKKTKKQHYFSQFYNVRMGFENAKKIDVLPGDIQRCRAYLSWFAKKNQSITAHGRTDENGDFWVALLEAEQ